MSEYKNGKVYKIIYIGNENINITYIGSTSNTLRDRFYHHKYSFKTWLNTKDNKKKLSIYPYFERFGIENFKIFLIKEYKICDIKHLHMYETLWMNKIKNINKIKAFQPLSKEQNRQTDIIYRENNKDKKAKYDKEYREKNKDKLKERLKEMITCECGKTLTKNKLSRHKQSKKHLKFLDSSL
jgi:hypothetical protein